MVNYINISDEYDAELNAEAAIKYDKQTDALRAALDEHDNSVARIGGCSNGYCLITGPAKGMRTNGGCRCGMNAIKAQLALRAALKLSAALKSIMQD